MHKPSAIARVIIVGVLVSSVLATQFGRVRRTVTAGGAFCWSFAAMAVGLGTIALAISYPYAILELFIMGLGLAWLPSNLMACAVEAVDESCRGRSVGLVRAGHSLAPALGVAVAEGMSRRTGTEGILLATAVLALAMLAGVAFLGIRGRAAAVSEG